MQQLWLSSPALGSCIPNLGHFFASNNLAEMGNLAKSFYGLRDPPLEHLSSKYQTQKYSHRGVLMFSYMPFFGTGTEFGVF